MLNSDVTSTTCINDYELVGFVHGQLASIEVARIDEHLDVCPSCRRLVAALIREEVPDSAAEQPQAESLDDVATQPDWAPPFLSGNGDAPEHNILPRGTIVGRYVVIDLVGAGNMAVVYAAYDPELNRKVALKILRTDNRTDTADKRRERFVREAQAMARLSHPCVIAIHDVGMIDDEVFIAMEFVEGETLTNWLRREKPGCAAVLAVFTKAGEGLTAAHQAGLVHRDFKPDNVLVGADGSVKVTDFGLARPTGDTASSTTKSNPIEAELSEQSALSQTLTQAGSLLGTPAYMAPEQYLGETADERSDQFSYCVALYEALYGERPFAGTSVAQLAKAVVQGRFKAPPTSATVPAWLRRVLRRGLDREPVRRYPSMSALLDQLRRHQRGTRKRWLAALALGGTMGALFALQAYGDNRDLCQGARPALANIWDEGRKQALQRGFAASDRPHASATFTRVAAGLDAYADDWVAMHTDACLATQVRGEQSAALLDLRMHCLARRAQNLDALVSMLSEDPDGELIDKAIESVQRLPDLDRCADVEALTAVVPPPEDAQIRTRVEALRRQVDRARVRETAGKYPAALQIAQVVVDEVKTLDYPPIRAEALLLQGELQRKLEQGVDAEESLFQAAEAAAQARDDERLLEVLIELTLAVGYKQSRPKEGMLLGRLAQAVVPRVKSETLHAQVLNSIAILYAIQGQPRQALEHFERAIAIEERLSGQDSLLVASFYNNASNPSAKLEDYATARRYSEQAIATTERVLGPNHPQLALQVLNYGTLLDRIGAYNEAQQQFERAHAINEAAFGKDHPAAADTLSALAVSLLRQQHYDEALRYAEQSIAVKEKHVGPGHPMIAETVNTAGFLHKELGHYDKARAYYTRSLSIWETALGSDHPKVARPLNNLSEIAMLQGNLADAHRYGERALAIRQKAYGPDHHTVAMTLNNLGQLAARERRYSQAQAHLERAVGIFENKFGIDHPDIGSLLCSLGSVFLDQGKPARGRQSFEQAREITARHFGDGHPELIKPLLGVGRSFLAERRFAEAVAPLTQAHTIATKADGRRPPKVVGESSFLLARALWQSRRDRARAVVLAEAARRAYETAGESARAELAATGAWLRRHGRSKR